MKNSTTLDWLYKWEKEKPNSIYLSQPINGAWHNWTFYDFGQEVRKMAAYIRSLNLKKSQQSPFIKNIGNSVSSSIPLLLSQDNLLKKKKIIICGFGVGLSISVGLLI